MITWLMLTLMVKQITKIQSVNSLFDGDVSNFSKKDENINR